MELGPADSGRPRAVAVVKTWLVPDLVPHPSGEGLAADQGKGRKVKDRELR